jgi:hypothetical protein
MRFAKLLRLYLDPFVVFKNINVGPPSAQMDALRFNRRHRGFLLIYARRWATIAVLCAFGMMPLGALAGEAPMLALPILGLVLGFSAAVCMLVVAFAVYVVLGLDAEGAAKDSSRVVRRSR